MNTTTPCTHHRATPMTTTVALDPQGHPGDDPLKGVRAATGRALVLGGGGSTGNAWLIGVLAGLQGAGLDVTAADETIGTSAGATAAAQIAGAAPTVLLADVLATPPGRRAAPIGPVTRPPAATPVAEHLARISAIIASAEGATDMRRRMGAAALDLESASDGSWQSRWRATVGSRLPSPQWPDRNVHITAVDAHTGEPVLFDRHSGVDLVDAVAASCASSLPYRIGGRCYIDGAFRRNENADLAAGCGRVLVLSPLSGRTLHPPDWGTQLAVQVEELRSSGSEVETVFPDDEFEHLFGPNAMDASLRPRAAQLGYEQGSTVAKGLTNFWR
jgi:NTE family protein